MEINSADRFASCECMSTPCNIGIYRFASRGVAGGGGAKSYLTEGDWCAGMKSGNHKTCLSCKK